MRADDSADVNEVDVPGTGGDIDGRRGAVDPHVASGAVNLDLGVVRHLQLLVDPAGTEPAGVATRRQPQHAVLQLLVETGMGSADPRRTMEPQRVPGVAGALPAARSHLDDPPPHRL